jgi:hypothetical protein
VTRRRRLIGQIALAGGAVLLVLLALELMLREASIASAARS